MMMAFLGIRLVYSGLCSFAKNAGKIFVRYALAGLPSTHTEGKASDPISGFLLLF
jgi:hypothetical protein